jgi:HSP20 family protein
MTMMGPRDIAPWSGGTARVPAFRNEPADLFSTLRQEVDRLFDEAFRGFGFGTPLARLGLGAGWPLAELTETEKELRVTFEVPGVDEKDIEVLLADGELVVRGEKRSETEDKDRRFTERVYGRFERRIPLDQQVEQEGIRAEFRNGVLTVTLPKSAQAEQRAKRIPVTAS